jgi:hypothetical protein
MKLDSLLLADSTRQARDGKLTIVGAGVTRASSSTVPFAVPNLVAVARFLLEGDDGDHSTVIQIRGRHLETGEAWFEGESVTVPSQFLQRHLEPHEENGVFFIINLDGVVFKRFGPHMVEVLMNDQVVNDRTIVVVQTDEPSGYEAVMRIAKDHPEWMDRVRAAWTLSAGGAQFAGKWVNDRTGDRASLKPLVSWDLLTKTGTSRGGSRAYYRMRDHDGVGRALSDLGLLSDRSSFPTREP